jgi:hypothetical protein
MKVGTNRAHDGLKSEIEKVNRFGGHLEKTRKN